MWSHSEHPMLACRRWTIQFTSWSVFCSFCKLLSSWERIALGWALSIVCFQASLREKCLQGHSDQEMFIICSPDGVLVLLLLVVYYNLVSVITRLVIALIVFVSFENFKSSKWSCDARNLIKTEVNVKAWLAQPIFSSISLLTMSSFWALSDSRF